MMPSAEEPSTKSANGNSSRSDQLAHYKKQYEQLESELADFQASSRELEAELEKEIEASEKRERGLKEKVDNLRYEVDEWKSKYKQSKSEASTTQNSLQKEITSLRETTLSLQLKLRDTEVANDDFERQARHTTSSLEDMESKFNMAIERGVLLEVEVKHGEQEREDLRIENQRLRDELNELKIETEIVQEKLRNGGRRRRPAPLGRSPSTPHAPEIFDHSPGDSTVSSPLFTTPPAKLSLSLASATATPPSPPMSETSTSMRKSLNASSGFPLQKASAQESFSRSMYGSRPPQRFQTHFRATSFAFSNFSNGRSTPSITSRPSLSKPNNTTTNPGNRPSGIPISGSLHQIRGLIGKMQKLEERVQSAKSKLPPPSETASRASSRAGSVLGDSPGASTLSMRRDPRKRLSGSSFSSSLRDGDPSYVTSSRPSYRTQGDSRPSSRTSFSSSFSHSTHPSVTPSNRPESRQSRTKTPLGHYSTNPTTESRRPRSSLSNPAGQPTPINGMSFIDEDEDLSEQMSARVKLSEARPTRLPSFSTPTGVKKRTVSGIPAPRSFRRTNTMGSPQSKPTAGDLGETF
ncbi:NUDE protein [Aspergillus oleicola]